MLEVTHGLPSRVLQRPRRHRLHMRAAAAAVAAAACKFPESTRLCSDGQQPLHGASAGHQRCAPARRQPPPPLPPPALRPGPPLVHHLPQILLKYPPSFMMRASPASSP
ncbi:hypothetical protein PLESTB_001454800 [Pleodorina starrii]|uniref:Uncharacterized protein n=1 Tax=Pleodorina starrii TaxID=330485 RepID=A0A9W6F7H3_9CHLO|nr:hypothetical protein PLESTM_000770700 [Pleodorina starrii]GLC59159.1 hypothetical protein PLESTB_001454800 [Pleodorina starrii]GLC65010.1 hypothetical protein PLESTF_000235800 [Pleodorina starrii]